jgi:hypothetical protein
MVPIFQGKTKRPRDSEEETQCGQDRKPTQNEHKTNNTTQG